MQARFSIFLGGTIQLWAVRSTGATLRIGFSFDLMVTPMPTSDRQGGLRMRLSLRAFSYGVLTESFPGDGNPSGDSKAKSLPTLGALRVHD
jgi:hypothetical protein